MKTTEKAIFMIAGITLAMCAAIFIDLWFASLNMLFVCVGAVVALTMIATYMLISTNKEKEDEWNNYEG